MKTNNSNHVLLLVQAAMIAALYVVLTFIANELGIASQAIQVRFSEALTILPYFTPAAIPGLYIGCLLANILTGAALPDVVFGPVATLIGAVLTWKLCQNKTSSKIKWMAPLPPIAANAIIIPPCFIVRLRHQTPVVQFCHRHHRRDSLLRRTGHAPSARTAETPGNSVSSAVVHMDIAAAG